MKRGFTTAGLDEKCLEVFQHELCGLRYHADLFWVTEAIGADQLKDLLEVFSRDCEQVEQPIIEVRL